MKKFIIPVVLLFVAFVISCGDSGSSDKKMSDENAAICSDVNQVVRAAASQVTDGVGLPMLSPSKKIVMKAAAETLIKKATADSGKWVDDTTISGIKVNGSYKVEGTTFTYDMTIEFKDYKGTEEGKEYILNGTDQLTCTLIKSTDLWDVSMGFKDNLSVAVGGASHKIESDYKMTMKVNISTDATEWTTKGTYVFDGETYSVDESGTD